MAMKPLTATTPPRMGSRTLPLVPAEQPGAVVVLTFTVVDPGDVVVTLWPRVVEVFFPCPLVEFGVFPPKEGSVVLVVGVLCTVVVVDLTVRVVVGDL